MQQFLKRYSNISLDTPVYVCTSADEFSIRKSLSITIGSIGISNEKT